jgi:hypothetical protein
MTFVLNCENLKNHFIYVLINQRAISETTIKGSPMRSKSIAGLGDVTPTAISITAIVIISEIALSGLLSFLFMLFHK